jgi:hypothetical protein
MPYIKNEDRFALAPFERPDGSRTRPIRTAGELNFLFTILAIEYIEANGLNYQNCNDVVGALDGAKAEFQRRVVAPYEDKKIRENGDVYPSSLLGG